MFMPIAELLLPEVALQPAALKAEGPRPASLAPQHCHAQLASMLIPLTAYASSAYACRVSIDVQSHSFMTELTSGGLF